MDICHVGQILSIVHILYIIYSYKNVDQLKKTMEMGVV